MIEKGGGECLRERFLSSGMAQSKEDILHGTAHARLSDGETLRVAYKHGTALEGGKISDSEPVDLFAAARKIPGCGAENPDNKAGASTEVTGGGSTEATDMKPASS